MPAQKRRHPYACASCGSTRKFEVRDTTVAVYRNANRGLNRQATYQIALCLKCADEFHALLANFCTLRGAESRVPG
jgi:hypothetical protein